MMQARLRGIKSLVRCAQRMMKPVVPVRVFSAEAAQAQDVYEHMSNMKTKDLFQFEPFNDEELVVCSFFVILLIKSQNFPRQTEGKDYSLNWSLASEWFTVWGNAYRNPSYQVLTEKIGGNVDKNMNVSCTRHYLPASEIQAKKGDFEEISDSVSNFYGIIVL